MIRLALVAVVISAASTGDNKFLGCYKERHSSQNHFVSQSQTIDQCIDECRTLFYRYSLIKNGQFCTCSNYLGEEVNSTARCPIYPGDANTNFTDVFFTGNYQTGPPSSILITDVTNTSIHVSWQAPRSHTQIISYLIKAPILHTYTNYMSKPVEWTYSNDTFRTRLSLLPATKYNITLSAITPEGEGAVAYQEIETLLGDPENQPARPTIVKRMGDKIEIMLSETINSNGPVSSYLVVVINEDNRQVFQEQFLKSFEESNQDLISFYIAAELRPEEITKNFIVGDGKYYGKYHNAPLDPNVNYDIIAGIVSTLHGQTKRAFSNFGHPIRNLGADYVENIDADSPAVIIGLSIAIGLLSFMLVAGIIGFIILKSKITNRRHRLSENQELTIQGPMIEVENNGYIPEEEHHTKASHYKNLKQKLRTIPYNQLKIEPTNLLGIGRFGRVNSGSIYENNTLIPVAVYTISDKKLLPDDKKNMLRDLDLLIKTGKHDNIVALMGTCETPQVVLVVLEYISMNLKDLLLGSRDSLPGRFSNMSENQALDIAINIGKGMAHLHANKIVHKQLCARNIMIANGFIPKIGGYGLAQFYSHNNLPDYTRWTALEVFKGQSHNFKSDVWSFACLLWEICVLGGTPYGNFSNNEVPERVTKGLRLPQMQYFSDELYQIMLSCWQIDMDERPDFNLLTESLELLKANSFIPYLSFSLYANFQYEQFYPDMEIAVRPVF